MLKFLSAFLATSFVCGSAIAGNVIPLAAYDHAHGTITENKPLVLSKPYDDKTFVSVYIQGNCKPNANLNVVILDKNQHLVSENIRNGCSLKLDFLTKNTGIYYIGIQAENQKEIEYELTLSDAPSENKTPVETGSMEGDEP